MHLYIVLNLVCKLVRTVLKMLIAAVNCHSFAGTTVGKRYARTDELGVPFGITVDGQTFEDTTVTVRERDSTKQVIPSHKALLSRLSASRQELQRNAC